MSFDKSMKALWQLPLPMVIIAELSFVAMSAFVKEVAHEVTLAQIVFFRSLVTVVIVGLLMIFFKIPFTPQKKKLVFFRSAAAAIAMSCNFYGISHLPFGNALILNMSFPIFVAFWALIFLHEKVTPKLLLLIAMAWLGIVLILQPSLQSFNGAGLVALSSAFFASFDVLLIHISHRSDHALRLTFYFVLLALLGSGLWLVADFSWPKTYPLCMILAAGLFGTSAQVFIARAYGIGKVSRLAPLVYFFVVLSFLLGIFLWHEIPNLWAVVGSLLVILCCVKIVRVEEARL